MDPCRHIDYREIEPCGSCHVAHRVEEMSEPAVPMRGLICQACEALLAAEADAEQADDGVYGARAVAERGWCL